jgi:23S rRNA pseudouridine1911/1915/1917 synthase
LEHFLVHGEHQAIVSTPKNPEAKKALLTYEVIRLKEHTSLVKIELQTGRYHQIRAQFAAIGHPIVGDSRYNGKGNRAEEIHLSCTELIFPHPITRKTVHYREQFFYFA